jgi:hypothetical protein
MEGSLDVTALLHQIAKRMMILLLMPRMVRFQVFAQGIPEDEDGINNDNDTSSNQDSEGSTVTESSTTTEDEYTSEDNKDESGYK